MDLPIIQHFGIHSTCLTSASKYDVLLVRQVKLFASDLFLYKNCRCSQSFHFCVFQLFYISLLKILCDLAFCTFICFFAVRALSSPLTTLLVLFCLCYMLFCCCSYCEFCYITAVAGFVYMLSIKNII